LEIKAQFAHRKIQDMTMPDETIAAKRGPAVWQALEAQDVSFLTESDLPTLKRRAKAQSDWLVDVENDALDDDYELAVACSVGTTINDIWNDNRYLNGPAIHVIRSR
jgi:hypothetical protein